MKMKMMKNCCRFLNLDDDDDDEVGEREMKSVTEIEMLVASRGE